MRLYGDASRYWFMQYFNPRTPYGMRRQLSQLSHSLKKFQSTHPLRDATRTMYPLSESGSYFNPRTPYGMRRDSTNLTDSTSLFQSTHPLRDATSQHLIWLEQPFNFNPRTPYGMRRDMSHRHILLRKFQSTHPLRDATSQLWAVWLLHWISIHAPLTGCDYEDGYYPRSLARISIHAPLTGCDNAFQHHS